jgi:hypothetical protein
MENNQGAASAADTSSATESQTDSTDVNSQEQGAEQQAQASNPALKKKYKVKIDQKEEELELDLNNDEEVKKHLQMSRAAQKRMKEAADTRKQAETFIKMLQENPVELLSNPKLGLDFRKIAEEYLYNQIQQESMSPEQRKQIEMEQRLRKYEEQEKTVKQQQESQQLEELQNHYAQDFDKKITDALKSSNLPKSPKTVKRMAELMYKNLQYGLELEPNQLVELVKQDYVNEIKELFGSSEGDILMSIMGDDIANKIRKADLARLQKSNPFHQSSEPQSSVVKEDVPQRRMSKDEWREYMDKKTR